MSVSNCRELERVFQEPFMVKDHKLHVTTSIGIAIFPHHGKDGDTLIKSADIALYCAKARGRNNYQYYTSAAKVQGMSSR